MPYLDDLNVPEPEGVGPMNINIRGGVRSSPAGAYLRPVMGRKNLTVVTGAQVVKLTLSRTRCTGVDFLWEGRRHSAHASREVILCAGAIHTPRLLLLSGIGPQGELAPLGIAPTVDLPGVGRNLQDHVLLAGLCFEAKYLLPPPRHNLAEDVRRHGILGGDLVGHVRDLHRQKLEVRSREIRPALPQRVRGIEGLRIADASVMPTIPSAPTHVFPCKNGPHWKMPAPSSAL
jgi:choline dehydrogenase-like flavoprotein